MIKYLIIGLLIGFFIGDFIGMAIMCILQVAKDDEEWKIDTKNKWLKNHRLKH